MAATASPRAPPARCTGAELTFSALRHLGSAGAEFAEAFHARAAASLSFRLAHQTARKVHLVATRNER